MDKASFPRLKAILNSVFVEDDDGNVFVRITKPTPTGTVVPAARSAIAKPESLLSRAVTLVDGKPTLRIVEVSEV